MSSLLIDNPKEFIKLLLDVIAQFSMIADHYCKINYIL
jgi:hypothetical protein